MELDQRKEKKFINVEAALQILQLILGLARQLNKALSKDVYEA